MTLPSVRFRFTGVLEGHLGLRDDDAGRQEVAASRLRITSQPWVTVRQVHGNECLAITDLGSSLEHSGPVADADALVTPLFDMPIAVFTADCCPVLLYSTRAIGVVHCGWRPTALGVVANSVEVMRDFGAGEVHAIVGPSIRSCCYEFSEPDLERLVEAFGGMLRGQTLSGRPSLDMKEFVTSRLHSAGVTIEHVSTVCTRCSPSYFSHRRADSQRQTLVAWRVAS